MMLYPMPQSPNVYRERFAFALKLFTPDECKKIIEIGSSLGLQQSRIGTDLEIKLSIRDSQHSWIDFNQERTAWIFERLSVGANQVNQQFWKLPLAGFFEPLQFTRYQAEGGYSWHQDIMPKGKLRKLSLTVQLTDEKEYDGGGFELFMGENMNPIPKGVGDVVFFPSEEFHRVAPMKSGVRHSLVAWIG